MVQPRQLQIAPLEGDVQGFGSSSEVVSISGVDGYIDAKLSRFSNITGHTLIEQSSVPGGMPGVGRGTIWVKDDTPNVLVFTDDDGNHTVLGSGGVAYHGLLGGLANDDHPQYLLVNGTRSMTGGLNMGSNPISNVTTLSASGNITSSGSVISLSSTFSEQASVPGGLPSSGTGKLWIRNTDPQLLIFTDENGIDRELAYSEQFDPNDLQATLSVGNITNGNDIHISFGDSLKFISDNNNFNIISSNDGYGIDLYNTSENNKLLLKFFGGTSGGIIANQVVDSNGDASYQIRNSFGIEKAFWSYSEDNDAVIFKPDNNAQLIINGLANALESDDAVPYGQMQLFANAAAEDAYNNANSYTNSVLDGYATQEYVDTGDSITLDGANSYTDSEIFALTSYIDNQDDATLLNANNYTNSVIDGYATISYVDSADSTILSSANNYTDGEIASLTTYIDNQDAVTLSSANTYADSLISISGFSILAKSDTGTGAATSFAMLNDSFIRREGSGNIVASSVGANTLLGRFGTSNLQANTISEGNIVGRPIGEALDAHDPSAFGLATESYVDSGDATTLSSANDYTDTAVTGLASESYVDAKFPISLTDIATQAANTFLANATGSTAAVTAVSVGTNTFLSRGVGNLAANSVSAHSILGRFDGANVGSAVISTNSLPLRGSGNLTIQSVAEGELVGRPLSGNLGSHSPSALGIATESYVDSGDATTLSSANDYTDTAVIGLATESYVQSYAIEDAAGTVSETNLATGSVTTNKIGDLQVTAGKIANTTITNSQISTSADIALSKLATQAANTIICNPSGSSAVPTALEVDVRSVIGRTGTGDISSIAFAQNTVLLRTTGNVTPTTISAGHLCARPVSGGNLGSNSPATMRIPTWTGTPTAGQLAIWDSSSTIHGNNTVTSATETASAIIASNTPLGFSEELAFSRTSGTGAVDSGMIRRTSKSSATSDSVIMSTAGFAPGFTNGLIYCECEIFLVQGVNRWVGKLIGSYSKAASTFTKLYEAIIGADFPGLLTNISLANISGTICPAVSYSSSTANTMVAVCSYTYMVE